MTAAASAAAILLYLLPVAVVVWFQRGRGAAALAIAMPMAVAVDLLGVLVLSLMFRVETAVLLARGGWVVGAAVWWWRDRGRVQPAPPRTGESRGVAARVIAALGPGIITRVGPAIIAALGLVLLSVWLSRPYAIWDRLWHEPLVASLRGQRLPFQNVFEPGRTLHYHFSGDVIAAALQVLSGNVLHASRALSLAHDVLFGLMGACLALLMRACGRGALASVGLSWLVALAGPITLIPIDDRYRYWGYSIHNFLTLSYRPHTVLFGLLATGVCAILLDRTRRRPVTLVVLLALMGVTDEVSAVLLLGALGVAWLGDPAVVHQDRRRGLIVLLLAAAAILGANLLFRASLAPGGPASAMQIVSPRAPGFGHPPLPITARSGALSLLLDLVPTVALAVALVIAGLRRAPALLALSLVAFGVAGLTAVEINHTPIESHRFMSAALLVVPLLAFAAARGRAARLLLGGAGLLASASTLAWVFLAMPRYGRNYRDPGSYALDCRRAVGAHLGERPAATYLSPAIWHAYSGCRPVYTAGTAPAQQWGISLLAALGPAALPATEALPRQGPLPVVCARNADTDPVCAEASTRPCQPAGDSVRICHR